MCSRDVALAYKITVIKFVHKYILHLIITIKQGVTVESQEHLLN